MAKAGGAARADGRVPVVGGPQGGRGSRLGAGSAFAAIAGLLLLSLVVPPIGATWIARVRVEEARRDVARLASSVSDLTVDGRVLAGPGRLPQVAGAVSSGWQGAARGAFAANPDPWGNAYLVCAAGDAVIALSAGTNGIIETRIVPRCGLAAEAGAAGPAGAVATGPADAGTAVSFGGDDVGVMIRVGTHPK